MFFALLVGAALSACCGNGSDGAPGTIDGEITVFATSSLSEAFKEVGAAFEKANPGTEVTFSFAASSALAVQINEGAPADVFASADTAQMKNVIDQGQRGRTDRFRDEHAGRGGPKGREGGRDLRRPCETGNQAGACREGRADRAIRSRSPGEGLGDGRCQPGLLGQGAGEP
ncbi:MAG: molybdate ABC transporter substrate-binding protein [Dehalococcoidia bacterium]|nr:molybdate ABC transporter substrate-binding protein [Dehalococcoidia bacterium]